MSLSIGLDLAFRRSGIAVIDAPSNIKTYTVKTTAGESIFYRVLYIRNAIWGLIQNSLKNNPIDAIVVVEGVALTGSTGVMMSGLHVAVVAHISEMAPEIPILIVPPPSLKMYIGVKGTAGKKPIIAKAHSEFDLGRKLTSDEADAYFLARLGLEFINDCRGGHSSGPAAKVLYQVKLNKRGIFKGLALRRNEYLLMPRCVTALTEKIELNLTHQLAIRDVEINKNLHKFGGRK